MPEMTETQTPGRKPKKKKNKESHNAVERHRKEKINAGINRIGNVLPCSQALKQSKIMILDQAFRYITELKKQNDTMLLEGGDKVQAEEIRRLRCQLEELRKESAHYIELLKAHDILEDPTIHWKGKQRCAKFGKVTPTHQMQKGIIVYSSGNVMCPAGKDASPGKPTTETIVLQQPSEVGARLKVNGALLQVSTSSPTPSLLPGSVLASQQSTPALRVVEQCVVETPAVTPSLPPSVSYITLQIPTVTTALPQQPQPPASVQTFTVSSTSASQLLSESAAIPVTSMTSLTQTIRPPRPTTADICSWATPDTAIRTVGYTAVPHNQPLLRGEAAGSTQTTWTTLQMAGNTVQPVCQSLPTPEVSNTTQAVQQVTVCPITNKPSVQPIQIQMQTHLPAHRAPITGHIQTQLRPTILTQGQPVASQPSCAVLAQSAIVPQPTGMAHSALVSQPQPAVIQPAPLVTHTPVLSHPQPALVHQPQATMLPLLQTMQVLQVKTASATAQGVTAPQSTNNPSVVILQQANTCPPQPVVREEITNQTACQHIVIIQAPNPSASATQNTPVAIGSTVPTLPAVSTQIPSTSSSTSVASLQTVGGKQLVHILPRPVQPQQNKCQHVPVTTSTSVAVTPQTITVNGQVFALQPVKTSDKLISNGGQSTLQLIQPTTTEEPTTNVALNSLGALSSLNQSITQGVPLTISSQNNNQSLPLSTSVVQQQPPAPSAISGSTIALPVSQLQVPSLKSIKSALVVNATKSSGRKLKSFPAKKATVKKVKPVKNKELKQKQPAVAILAKATTVTSESQTVSNVLQSTTVDVTQITSSSTTAVTSTTMTTSTDCNQRAINVTTTQGTAKIIVSSDEVAVSDTQSICSVSSSQTEEILNTTNTSLLTTAVTTITPRPLVSSSTVSEIKPILVASTKMSIPEVKLQTTCAESSTTQKKTTDTTLSESLSCGLETLHHTNFTNTISTATMSATKNPARSSSVCRPHGLDIPEATPCIRSEPAPTSAASITEALVSLVSPFSSAPNTTTVTSLGPRRVVTAISGPTQKNDINTPRPSSCRPPEAKPPQGPRTEKEAQEERHNTVTVTERETPVTVNSEIVTKKDFTLIQRVYTNLDDQTMEPSMTLSRQTESPISTVAGGRGFSVASMLPQGHSISAASSSFSTFTFTSEQAEMLALAMLEQDSPDRKTGGCSGDKTASSNPSTATWEPTKTPPVSTAKECGSATGQQVKLHKTMDTVKTTVHLSVRGQLGEGCGLSGSRHPQNILYSQTQSVPQPQNSTHTSTVASLSVNNLIRPNSSQQPYSGSPNLAGQQTPVLSPVATTTHTSHPSNNALSPCSGAAQNNEYTPLKTALLRSQAGVSVGERQLKIIPKRQAQEEVIINSGKRPKPCPPSGNTVNHMEVKRPDHSQLMVGQLPPTSSAVMTRINSDSGGSLFSNPFMSPVVRPSDGHCPPQGLPEQNQPGVLHLPQGHLQHATPQSGSHLGGNPYMKQEQQRQHLYHLQQHLTQPDPAQRHSLHQRALQQQQEQQQQHAQKKRGLVRGSQTASPAALQQKQQQQAQQHPQQSHQPPQQHQQTPQHSQPHPQQHPQQSHQQQAQHQQQLQQSSHSRHHQHLQQQIQQQQQHFRHQDKSCEAQSTGPRPHHSSHLVQQDHLKAGQDHNAMQRMMSSRNLEQTLISPPSNPVSRSSERHRVSNYSAEALIGKSSTSDQQRMSLHLQPGRGAAQEQPDLRGYLETSRTKANITHNPQNRLPSDHPGSADVQRISECPSFKAMGGPHQLGGFEVQVSRGNDMTAKSGPPAQRGPQGQQPGGFRMGGGPPADARNRGAYNGAHAGSHGVQVGPALSREQEGCHQSFMQSLLSPHLPEQSNHQQLVQCCPPVSMEYSCVPGSSSADIQGKASSPSVPQTQKAPAMRLAEGNKGHISQVGGNMHGGPGVRTGLPHPSTPHSSADPGRSSAPSRPPTSVSQHSRHIARDTQPTKLRPGDRPRSGTLRSGNPFESDGHLPLSTGLLSRPQSGGEARRSTIVRFMPDTTQVPSDNNLVPDQHLTQNFGFPFIPEGGMNPPPPINANSTFIPPVSQPSASRTPSLLPVEPQNTLPSFYPSYSPAAHPSLPSDVTLQYFPNQMFTSPSADKGSGPPLNNRFGSILSPPRPVGFGQASFPLLPEMPPMPPIANSSGITPHISNFSLTSLFPEIATGMPPDGSAMPMSPLLSLSNTSSADSGKQPNRPAHNISHILGHDGSSAV